MFAPAPHLGIHSIGDLRAQGHTRYSIAAALSDGGLTRIRRGWYADTTADPDTTTAVRVGGLLTANSAARRYGLWTPDDASVHVLVARNASRLRLGGEGDTSQRPICLHWAKGALTGKAIAEPLQVIADALHCRGLEDAVVIADSALNLGMIRADSLGSGLRVVRDWCDARSQSGTESLTRLRLRRRRVPVRTQVRIPDVGIVDLLIGERLVIECDSKSFHDGYQSSRDYDRDLALVGQGYLVLRLQYRHVMFEWERIERLILEIVRARRHLWRHGRAGSVVSL